MQHNHPRLLSAGLEPSERPPVVSKGNYYLWVWGLSLGPQTMLLGGEGFFCFVLFCFFACFIVQVLPWTFFQC